MASTTDTEEERGVRNRGLPKHRVIGKVIPGPTIEGSRGKTQVGESVSGGSRLRLWFKRNLRSRLRLWFKLNRHLSRCRGPCRTNLAMTKEVLPIRRGR